jgi:hypothetical protein
VVALQRGQVAQAIELIEKAIARDPSVAAFHANLAEAYRAAGQLGRPAQCRVLPGDAREGSSLPCGGRNPEGFSLPHCMEVRSCFALHGFTSCWV